MLGIAAAGGLLGALLAPPFQRRLTARVALVGKSWVLALSIPLLLIVHDALLIGVIVTAAELITPVTNSFVVGFRVALAPSGSRALRHPPRLEAPSAPSMATAS
jgi:hypothetical protein